MKAVLAYEECAEKHRCTPLQLELLSDLVKCEKEDLLQRALDATSKVHGPGAARLALVKALAQNGKHKPLRKFLIVRSEK